MWDRVVANIPNKEPTRMTKMAEILTPSRPSNSLPASQPPSASEVAAAAAVSMMAEGATCRATTLVKSTIALIVPRSIWIAAEDPWRKVSCGGFEDPESQAVAFYEEM